MKVRVITFDTKENTIEDKTFPEFNSGEFDDYLTERFKKLENGEIFGIKIIRSDGMRRIPTIFRYPVSKTEVCVPV